MGKVAETFADLSFITTDNPRSENPEEIVRHILLGYQNREKAVVVPDRKQAIKEAIHAAKRGDIVLIAGKGHEKMQIFAHQTVAFDDVAVAKEALQNQSRGSAILLLKKKSMRPISLMSHFIWSQIGACAARFDFSPIAYGQKGLSIGKKSNHLLKKIFLALLVFLIPLYPAATGEGGAFVASLLSPAAPTIVIDPGHGGNDLGARGKAPFCEEKRVCLQTARLVKKYLDQLGYHVVLTRNTDAFVSLSRRVEIASQASSSAFVSIHYNSSRNPSANGIEIFFLFDSKEERGRSISSKKLADAVLPRLIRRTEAVSRGVKKGNFYVIRETSMPAILVEGGFVSNPQERMQLKTREYQEKIARALADGIDHYFKARWRALRRDRKIDFLRNSSSVDFRGFSPIRIAGRFPFKMLIFNESFSPELLEKVVISADVLAV